MNLGAIYTAEKGFFYEANAYNNDLVGIGFAEPDGNLYFSIGFATGSCGTCSDRAHKTQSDCTGATPPETWTPGKCKYDSSSATRRQAPGAACVVAGVGSAATFKAGAVGNGTASELDEVGANYQMNEEKNLKSLVLKSDCS